MVVAYTAMGLLRDLCQRKGLGTATAVRCTRRCPVTSATVDIDDVQSYRAASTPSPNNQAHRYQQKQTTNHAVAFVLVI